MLVGAPDSHISVPKGEQGKQDKKGKSAPRKRRVYLKPGQQIEQKHPKCCARRHNAQIQQKAGLIHVYAVEN